MLTREPGLAASAEYNRKLEPTVEWHGQARERRVGLPRLGVRAQGVGVQDDIVRDHERAGLELWPSELEQLLVELVGGVQEDDVEHVVDHRQRLEASPSTSSAVSSRPASAMLCRQSATHSWSRSSESTRPPRWRTAVASQIVE